MKEDLPKYTNWVGDTLRLLVPEQSVCLSRQPPPDEEPGHDRSQSSR